MLTSRGITMLAGAALAWLAGRTLGVAELYAVAVAGAAVVAIGALYVRLSSSSVSARRVVDVRSVVAGTPVDVVLELRNDAPVPSPTLVVQEQVPAVTTPEGHHRPGQARFVVDGVGPGRVTRARYRLVPRTRGRYEIGPVVVRLADPFGLAERVRRYTATTDVIVYPEIERLPASPVRGSHMGAGSSDTRRVFATGEDFYTMREYVRGDDLRHVHWPSTAHRQTLMVRQMEQPWQAHATIHLDARRAAHTLGPTGTLEKAVSVAASLVYHLADEGYQLRLVTDSTAGRVAPTPWEAALETLAVLQPSDTTGLAPSLSATRGGEGLLVAVVAVPPGRTDLAGEPDMRALFAVRGYGQRIALVVAPRGDERGQRMAGLLRAAGWTARTVAPGQPLGEVWGRLSHPEARRPVGTGPGR